MIQVGDSVVFQECDSFPGLHVVVELDDEVAQVLPVGGGSVGVGHGDTYFVYLDEVCYAAPRTWFVPGTVPTT